MTEEELEKLGDESEEIGNDYIKILWEKQQLEDVLYDIYLIENKADLCPICKGTGTFQVYTNYGACTSQYERTCHGCGGKGWVVIPTVNTTVTGG